MGETDCDVCPLILSTHMSSSASQAAAGQDNHGFDASSPPTSPAAASDAAAPNGTSDSPATTPHRPLCGHTSATVLLTDDSSITVHAYRYSNIKLAIFYLLTAITLGLYRLVLYWKPAWHAEAMADVCLLHEADLVLIWDEHRQATIRYLKTVSSPAPAIALPVGGGEYEAVGAFRYFSFRKLRLLWHADVGRFVPVYNLDHEVPITKYHRMGRGATGDAIVGLSEEEAHRRQPVHGRNVIAVAVTPLLVLLFKEVISPFYVFQVFSVAVWFMDDYIYYAAVIVFVSALSISLDVYQIRSRETALRDMVESTGVVDCVRAGVRQRISSDALVPGDVVVVPRQGAVMQCDAVLLSGSCVVDESMLTGESVPVTKTALPEPDDDDDGRDERMYSQKEHAKHTLFCGTHVLQARHYGDQPTRAMVIRTGFSTTKGQLVRSIMYPKPVDFQFTKDLFRFIGVLAVIAGCGFVYAVVIMIHRDQDVKEIILRSLDIITIVVPPALPAAMTVGILAAQVRLRRQKIFCISPSTINTCGSINLVCFDKTGTLTEHGLDFHGAVAVAGHRDSDDERPVFGPEFTRFYGTGEDSAPPTTVSPNGAAKRAMVRAMAACHGLTKIDGKILGDPIDLILFAETGWTLEEPPHNVEESSRLDTMLPTLVRSPPNTPSRLTACMSDAHDERLPDVGVELGIVRQFPFSSHLQCQSVLVNELNSAAEDALTLYSKGAPERIAALCLPHTVPENLDSVVGGYAKRGYRLIALAQRQVQMTFTRAQKTSREAVEVDLDFLGIVVLENRLKKETVPVIRQLNAANIRSVMATGDNLHTAICVAVESSILMPRRALYILELEEGELTLRRVALNAATADALPSSVDQGFAAKTADNDHPASVETALLTDCRYQIAIAGPTFAHLNAYYPPDVLSRLAAVTAVYARMLPEQKTQLIGVCQSIGYTVAMCGDGANDCGALKAAHAGISLSEAEASIASPFTSQTPDIRCVPTVVREGRAALVTSYGIVQYMASYSLTQFLSVSLLYWLATNLGDFQFLYVDLCLITVLALLFGYTRAADRIDATPPPARILTVPTVASLLAQLSIITFFQMFVFLFAQLQPWYTPPPAMNSGDVYASYEGTCVFLIANFQYVTLAAVYNKGRPYRRPVRSNTPLCLALLVGTAANLVLVLAPPRFLFGLLVLKPPPDALFRLLLVVLAAVNAVVCYLTEAALVDYLLARVAVRKRWCGAVDPAARLPFAVLRRRLGASPDWIRQAVDAADREKERRPEETSFATPVSGL